MGTTEGPRPDFAGLSRPELEAALAAALDRAEEAERMERSFLESVTHELRTPLNAILGFTDALVKGVSGPLNDTQKRQLQSIEHASRRLVELVNDTLELAKGLAGELEPACQEFDLAFVARSVATELAGEGVRRGLYFTLDPGSSLQVRAFGDARRAQRALAHLVSNAIKFTEKGGVVVYLEEGEGVARVLVRDTGIGIAREQLPLVFRPFNQLDSGRTRHYEGAGLGLSLAKILVEAMGGRILAESEPGRGSTFGFELPASPPPAKRPKTA